MAGERGRVSGRSGARMREKLDTLPAYGPGGALAAELEQLNAAAWRRCMERVSAVLGAGPDLLWPEARRDLVRWVGSAAAAHEIEAFAIVFAPRPLSLVRDSDVPGERETKRHLVSVERKARELADLLRARPDLLRELHGTPRFDAAVQSLLRRPVPDRLCSELELMALRAAEMNERVTVPAGRPRAAGELQHFAWMMRRILVARYGFKASAAPRSRLVLAVELLASALGIPGHDRVRDIIRSDLERESKHSSLLKSKRGE